jgi:hypothetical protein
MTVEGEWRLERFMFLASFPSLVFMGDIMACKKVRWEKEV